MILYYLRHAQSQNNALAQQTDDRTARQADPILTDIGVIQADLLAKFLTCGFASGGGYSNNGCSGFGITHVYTSLMLRAVATGTQISEELGIPLVALPDLHEYGGIFIDDQATGKVRTFPGKTRSYYEHAYPRCVLPEDLDEDGWWKCKPFETHEEAQARAMRVVNFLLQAHDGKPDRVALISHAEFYNDFLCALLNLKRVPETWFTIHNTGITRIDVRGNDRRVVYMNRTAHLPADLLTA